MKRNYMLLACFITLMAAVGSLYFSSRMPSVVPIHWDIHGRANGYGPKWEALWLMPGVMALMILLMAALPWLSPRKYAVSDGKPAYLQVLIVLLAFFAYMHAILLWASTGGHIDVGRAVVAGVCALFVAMGPLLARLPRNFYVGIRTPWTLASEQVWEATHRFAGRCFTAAGLIGLVLTLAGVPVWVFAVFLIVGGLAPVVHSLVYYKQLEHRGAA